MKLNIIIFMLLCYTAIFFSITPSSNGEFFQASRISQVLASGNDVFVTWEESTKNEISILFRKSSDGGQTFGKTIQITNDLGIAVPKPMAISENHLYVTWGSSSDKSPQVLFRKSDDMGNTFKPVITLSDKDKICVQPYALLATGSSVHVFFSCYDSVSQEASIVFRTSHDYGETFEKPITIFKGKNLYSNVIVSATVNEKNLFVAFQSSYDISVPSDIMVRSSYDGGVSFNDSIVISDGKFWNANPQILVSKNHVYVTWIGYDGSDFKYLFFKKSDDTGKTFGNQVILEETKTGDFIDSIPSIIANDGNVYVAWNEVQFVPDARQTRVFYFKASSDGGNNFTPITDIYEKPRTMSYSTYHAVQSGVDQNVNLIWHQTISDVFDTVGIFFKNSVDGGKTFENTINFNMKNYLSHQIQNPQLTVNGDDVYVVGDTADKGHEIFFVASHDSGKSFGKILDLNERNTINQSRIESPLEQIKSGTHPNNIVCKVGFSLVIREYDDSPACVRPASLAKFLSDGWYFGISDKAEDAIKDTKNIITIGEKIPKTDLVPITVTQITNVTKPVDTITFWSFQPIGLNADNARKTWGFLPNDYVKFEITDNNNNYAVDTSRMPNAFGIPSDLHMYPTICGPNEKVYGESGHPPVYPIKDGISQVYAKNTERGLLPDSEGKYSFNFVSLFETHVEFPKDVSIILNETKSCILQSKIDDFEKSFYTRVVFKIS